MGAATPGMYVIVLDPLCSAIKSAHARVYLQVGICMLARFVWL